MLALFLFRQEKGEKKPTQEALSCRAPARQSRPLVYPPAHIAGSAQHLNLNPVQAENVPIFCLKFGASYIGRAARAAAAAYNKTIRF